MLDSIYHNMMFKFFCSRVFGVKTSRFCQIYANMFGCHLIMLPKSVNH